MRDTFIVRVPGEPDINLCPGDSLTVYAPTGEVILALACHDRLAVTELDKARLELLR